MSAAVDTPARSGTVPVQEETLMFTMATQPETTPTVGTGTSVLDRPEEDHGWVTVLHNDPVTPMPMVIRALQQVLGMERVKAEAVMFEAHENGKAPVADGTQEQCETWAKELHRWSLWATWEQKA